MTAFALAASAGVARAHPACGIVADDAGHVLFVQQFEARVYRLGPDGTLTVVLDGAAGREGAPRFQNPHQLVLDAAGNLYTVGERRSEVWRVARDGSVDRHYPEPGSEGAGAPAFRLGLGGDPFAVAPTGEIYAVDEEQRGHCRIVRVARSGRVSTLAGGDWGYRDGPADAARFGGLHGGCLALAGDGSLYLTEAGRRVRRIAPDGTVTTIAGTDRDRDEGPAGATGPRFAGLFGLALVPDGSILVADAGQRRILRIAAGGEVSVVAGSGEAGSRDGPALEATFEDCAGVAVDRAGAIHVLDTAWDGAAGVGRVRVRTLGADGHVRTRAVVPPAAPGG